MREVRRRDRERRGRPHREDRAASGRGQAGDLQDNIGDKEAEGKDEDGLLQIVTGAPNVFEGAYVPVALHNSLIPGPLHGQPKQEGGVKITKGKLRGVPSNGMLCSCGEMGFEDKVVPIAHRDGIWILDPAIMGIEAGHGFCGSFGAETGRCGF